ncbi:MAG: tripartite tricarboxylate transporter substrate-binding protein, partial [Pseudomonadota bacterium]
AMALGLSTMSGAALAQNNCGIDRPIRVVVGYGAGGGTDSYARILAGSIPEFLDGTPMVVVNRPGGAQVNAMRQVLDADADGLTVQVAAMGGALMSTMIRDQGIDWFEDFRAVAQFGETNQALVVQTVSGITTAEELLASIRQRFESGEKTTWSHPGRGSVSHVGVTAFLELNGVLEMTQDVPFQGGGETRNALLSGDVDFSASGVHTVPAFADRLVAVGLLAEERDPVVDNVATLAEQGVEFVPTSSPIIVAAPAGVSDEYVECLSSAVAGAVEHRSFLSLTSKAKQAVVYRDSGETTAYLEGLADAWKPTVDAVRATLEN